MPRPGKSDDAFVRAIEEALEHIDDPTRLAESPLPAPFFIGSRPGLDESTHRTDVLVSALRSAAQALDDDQRELMRVTFFERDARLNNLGLALKLNKSESTYYRHRLATLEALARELALLVAPPLRGEAPGAAQIFGRAHEIDMARAALSAGKSVAISGPGGVGKTSLGTRIAADFGARAFWFTVRPGVNDQLPAFVFSLAYFLQRLGATATWRQLVASGDTRRHKAEVWLGMLRHDLASITPPALLCVDEADLLNHALPAHDAVLQLLQALAQSGVPIVWMGQRLVATVDTHIRLDGLGESAIGDWFGHLGLAVPEPRIRLLRQATAGNAAMLAVIAGLMRNGESIAHVGTSTDPAVGDAVAFELEPLLARAWRRLDEPDRALLFSLAVYDGAAPADAFKDDVDGMQRLEAANWLRTANGGAQLAAHARPFVLGRASHAELAAAHSAAAGELETRSDYTSAARHWVLAGQPALAVWLWLKHMPQERARGNATAALAVFNQVAPRALENEEDRRALALVRAELAKSLGDAAGIQQELDGEQWPATHPLSAAARRLQGDALELQGRIDQALAHYRAHLNTLAGALQRHELEAHFRLGYLAAYRLGNPSAARREATLMLLKAEEFSGMVQAELGQYGEALSQYERALHHARTLADGRDLRARLHERIGSSQWRAGQVDLALVNLQTALSEQLEIGNHIAALFARLNLCAAQCVARQYALARSNAEVGFGLAEKLSHSYLTAAFAVNGAEACHGLGLLDEAEQLAMRALQQEEAPNRPYALTVLGMVQLGRGLHKPAAETLLHAVEAARDVEDKYAEAHAQRWLARAHRNAGDTALSSAALATALALFEGMGNNAEAQATRDMMS